MGFCFRKSIKIAPGIKLNIGKKSTGISIGNKYGGFSINSKTGVKSRATIPGTGLSYTHTYGGKKKTNKKHIVKVPLTPEQKNARRLRIIRNLKIAGAIFVGLCILGIIGTLFDL